MKSNNLQKNSGLCYYFIYVCKTSAVCEDETGTDSFLSYITHVGLLPVLAGNSYNTYTGTHTTFKARTFTYITYNTCYSL